MVPPAQDAAEEAAREAAREAGRAASRPASLSPRHRVPPGDAGAGRAGAIVGAGFSGTMAAIHLRHALPPDCAVILFDRSGRFARGPAYAANAAPHLLNVRSANMSALPDDPGHFERWRAGNAARWPGEVQVTDAGTFATRRIYGRYLRALLYQEMSQSGGRVRLCADEAVGVDPVPGGYRLRCSSGRTVAVSAVVVATGNLPSSRTDDGVVVHDPWKPGATAGLRAGEPVLVLDMAAGGFGGPIIALSRRGLVPQRHGAPGPAVPCEPLGTAGQGSLTALLRRVRARVRTVQAAGGDWRAVIDGLRPVTAALWQAMPLSERNRFLRHLRPYWDVHRHRLAPGPAAAFAELAGRGVLRLKRGRVRSLEVLAGPDGPVARVAVQDRGAAGTVTLTVQRLIYATGIGTGTDHEGFAAGLIAAGLARTDRHGMGVEVTDRLRLVDAAGKADGAAWALGPIVRGVFWECTAVPDIRVQAVTVAAQVARSLLAARAGSRAARSRS